MQNENNNQLASSRKFVIRDINALLQTAPISRIKTLRDDEGRSKGVGQVLPDNRKGLIQNNSCVAGSEQKLLRSSVSLILSPSFVLTGHLPPHGEAAHFNAPSTWREGAVPEGLYPGVAKGRVSGKRAFTLIELLVVVLIIGILAAVALPQYQFAVAKSKITQALLYTDTLWEAQQLYFLQEGHYASSFDQLDISLRPNASGSTLQFPGGNCYVYSSSVFCGMKIASKFVMLYRNTSNTTRQCYAYRGDDKGLFATKLCASLGATTLLGCSGHTESSDYCAYAF